MIVVDGKIAAQVDDLPLRIYIAIVQSPTTLEWFDRHKL